MARYIQWDYVTRRYPSFSELAGANGQGSSWIGQGEDEVDAWLGARYAVPFTAPIPPVVCDLSADIAYYKGLLLRHGDQAESLWSYIEKRLTALRDGDMVLVTSGGIISQTGSEPWGSHTQYGTSFGMLDPVEWGVSSTWLSDEVYDRGG